MKYEERKQRIYMRGVKIGTKRGGDSGKGMQMFEQSKNKSPAEAQKSTENAVKESLSDADLGI